MNRVVITDFEQFDSCIKDFEASLNKIKDIFVNEKNTYEKINATDVWTSDTQSIVYDKCKSLSNNFEPIETSLQLYINFLKKTISDYRAFEENVNKQADSNEATLNVNS